MSLDVIRSIMNYTDWKYFRHSWSTHLSPTVTRSTRLLWGKLNCCKVFGSIKCLQQVFEGQRFTVSFSQHPKGVKIMVTPYLRQLSKYCTYRSSFSLTTLWNIISLALQMRKLRHRDDKKLTQDHRASQWQSWDLKPSSMTSLFTSELYSLCMAESLVEFEVTSMSLNPCTRLVIFLSLSFLI